MDKLPDDLVLEILSGLHKTKDRNKFSSISKRYNALENQQRLALRFGHDLIPTIDALLSLSRKFPNLSKLEIWYPSQHGPQVDDQGLIVLATYCKSLTGLTLVLCASITDDGLDHLSLCNNLSSLKLAFALKITSRGLSSVAVRCKKLKILHLFRCQNVAGGEWLGYFGNKVEALEELRIRNCVQIREDDLISLGNGWRRLRSFQFEAESNNRYALVEQLYVEPLWVQLLPCDNLVDISLVKCTVIPGRALACVLRDCINLEKLHLDLCFGISDSDVMGLAEKAKNLRSISIRVPPVSVHDHITLILAGQTLNAIAQHCSKLESFKILFAASEFPSRSSLTLQAQGLINLVQNCPIRELSLHDVKSFNDAGMEALCAAQNLEVLEIIQSGNVTDQGLIMVSHIPSLKVLKLSKCVEVTDYGFIPFVGSNKLEFLAVEECPNITRIGVQNAAKSVSFR